MIMGMKKFVCLLLAMMLLLSVTACGSDGGNVDEFEGNVNMVITRHIQEIIQIIEQ